MANTSIPKYASKKQARIPIPIEALIGQKFGRLTVVSEADRYRQPNGRTVRRMNVVCDCGNELVVSLICLRQKHTKSCGCLDHDVKVERFFKHGLIKHPLYKVWLQMNDRCRNPNNKGYDRYGGRGIHVCQEWQDDFKSFYDWATENGWAKGLLLDRRDNDRGYNEQNCRFVDASTSACNTRLLRSDNPSGYRGVTFYKRDQKYRANITLEGKQYFLGSFDDPIEAAHIYDNKVKGFGSEHPLNFPNEVTI